MVKSRRKWRLLGGTLQKESPLSSPPGERTVGNGRGPQLQKAGLASEEWMSLHSASGSFVFQMRLIVPG